MRVLLILLLGVFFVTLIAGSVESVAADHSLPGEGVFKDESNVNLASSVDSKYQIHLQLLVRNAENQLVTVAESVHGYYIPHQITDQIFDELSGKREIVIIDKMKYEKIQQIYIRDVQQFPFTTSYKDVRVNWYLGFNVNIDGHGVSSLPAFQAMISPVSLTEDDTLTFYWTFLRVVN